MGEEWAQDGRGAKKLRGEERATKDGEDGVTGLEEFAPVASALGDRIPRGEKREPRRGAAR